MRILKENTRNCHLLYSSRKNIDIASTGIKDYGLTCRSEYQILSDWKQVKTTKVKRKVRFADEEGGILCSIKVFETDHLNHSSDICNKGLSQAISHYRVVYNEARLHLKHVCVVAFGLIGARNIFGAIAVRNISFEKIVTVRLTFNNWKTFENVPAKFTQQEYDGVIDRFLFIFPIAQDFIAGSSVKFAACYHVNEKEYWDNNEGSNYKLSR